MSHEDEITAALKTHSISDIVAERMARDPEYAEYIRQTRVAMQPILDDLAKIGYKIDWLSDLRRKKSWATAIPILLDWLPRIKHRNLELDIIRCLSVPWTGSKATGYFIEKFTKVAELDPQYAWVIGNALSIVDVTGREKAIISLCRNSRFGSARQMVVIALHRIADPDAENTALDLLDENDVRLHAIIALGKMKSKRALFQLEKLLADKNPAIRKEARKAITKIMR